MKNVYKKCFTIWWIQNIKVENKSLSFVFTSLTPPPFLLPPSHIFFLLDHTFMNAIVLIRSQLESILVFGANYKVFFFILSQFPLNDRNHWQPYNVLPSLPPENENDIETNWRNWKMKSCRRNMRQHEDASDRESGERDCRL